MSEGTWEELSQVAVDGAEYDSQERQPHSKCLEGTRVDLLKFIYGLLDNPEKNQLVWLHGTAGVGKSAVAFTVAERMRGLKVTEEMNVESRLAGTFFFSRKHTKRSTAGYFFTTLVYQLANNFPSIQADVNRTIRENPAILDPRKSLRDQMEALFLRPLRKLQPRLRECPPLTFVVDALDECTSEPELIDLVLLLARALREPDLPATHILVTSRSESYIRKVFQNEEVRPLVVEIPVRDSGEGIATIISLDGADVDHDIYIFLQHSFQELQSRHPGFPQPSKFDLAKLASFAGRRFIVASTMMKFIIDDEDHDPHDRLQLMLELTSEMLPGTEVYKLYDCILSTCTDPKRAYMHLSIVAALADPLPISQISVLLGPGSGGDVQTTLIQLRSVVDIPTDASLPVNIHHSSIRDYVSDPSNCSLLREHDIVSPHSLLARSCLILMMQNLPESATLLDAFSELQKQSRATQPQDPRNLKHSLSFIVQPLEPMQVLVGLLWLRGDRGPELQAWLETLDGRAWLDTLGGYSWLETSGGCAWLETFGARAWLETLGARAWLETLGAQAWLQAPGGRAWLETLGGRAWLETLGARAWLVTLGGCAWLALDGRAWLETSAGRAWLALAGRAWLETSDGRAWLETSAGHAWLETSGCAWLETSGRAWLQTDGGKDWLGNPKGRAWLQTPSGEQWGQIESGENWLRARGGIQDWLLGRGGVRTWLQAQEGIRAWLQTESGRDWLQTPYGQNWLQIESGRGWLQTQGGRDWLQTQWGQDWLQAQGGEYLLQTQGGEDWLLTENGRNWLQTQSGRDWLWTESGRDWLQTQGVQQPQPDSSRRNQLQTDGGRGRLQTERGWGQMTHGQARQSPPVASVSQGEIMEEFRSTLEAISEYIIVPQLLSLPAFQVIQLFKSLPDFLMFPAFLALRHRDHSTSPLPQPLPDREVTRAMKTFMEFANVTLEQGQSTSNVLQYACQNWAIHLSRAPTPWDDRLNYIFEYFWNRGLLSWLERQWCLKGLQSCLAILYEGQKLAKGSIAIDSFVGIKS